MVILKAFGGLDIEHADRGSAEPLLAQSKRAALFAYLALRHAGGLCRRDHLLALFWPDLDEGHGRHALSQALTFVRRHVGSEVVITRGRDEVGVDGDQLTCDVFRFEEAAGAGDWAKALELYSGDLLEGLHVAGAPDFSDWVDRECHRLREVARELHWRAAHACLASGRVTESERHGAQALVLSPTDESPVRTYVLALSRSGDRGAALRFYGEFAALLRCELEVEPSPETLAVMDVVRSGEGAQGDEGVTATSADLEPVHTLTSPPIAPRSEAVTGGAHAGRTPGAGPPPRRPSLLLKAMAGVALPLAAWALITALEGPSVPEPMKDVVIVPPFENRSGDATLNDVADLAATWVGDAIQQVRGAQVVPFSSARRFVEEARTLGVVDPLQAAAERSRAGWVVRGAARAFGDSVELRLEIIEPERRSMKQQIVEVGSRQELNRVMDRLGRRAAGALSYEFDPWMKEAEPTHEPLPAPPTIEAFREYRRGYQAYDRGVFAASFRHHMAALQLDTTMVRAAVAAAYMTTDPSVKDSLATFAEQRRHRLTVKGRLDLDILQSLGANDLAGGLRAIREMARLEGGGFSSVLVSSFAARMNLPAAGFAATEEYDPHIEWRRGEAHAYWFERCKALHMLGRYEEELAEARTGRGRYPARTGLRNAEVRALAALGRIDEAMALLREGRTLPGGSVAMALEAGLELRAHGAAEASGEAFRWAVDRLVAEDRAGNLDPGADRLRLAEALYLAERWAEAEDVASAFLEEAPDDLTANGLFGLAAARLGDTTLANEVVDRLSRMGRRYRGGQHLLQMASITAVLGRPDEAMNLLYRATADGLPYGLWMHRDVNLESLRDREDFQALIAPKG